MYSLEIIQSASFQNPAKHAAPALTDRDCSACQTRAGIVFHSARHRSTLFLPAFAPNYKATLASLKRRGREGRNRLIESFF